MRQPGAGDRAVQLSLARVKAVGAAFFCAEELPERHFATCTDVTNIEDLCDLLNRGVCRRVFLDRGVVRSGDGEVERVRILLELVLAPFAGGHHQLFQGRGICVVFLNSGLVTEVDAVLNQLVAVVVQGGGAHVDVHHKGFDRFVDVNGAVFVFHLDRRRVVRVVAARVPVAVVDGVAAVVQARAGLEQAAVLEPPLRAGQDGVGAKLLARPASFHQHDLLFIVSVSRVADVLGLLWVAVHAVPFGDGVVADIAAQAARKAEACRVGGKGRGCVGDMFGSALPNSPKSGASPQPKTR